MFVEDDYFPVYKGFDAALVRMYNRAFPDGRLGVLAGVVQGRPVEPGSRHELHLETAHIMSADSLNHLFHHVYVKQGWRGSTAARMITMLSDPIAYYGGAIQAGFGMLLLNASIEITRLEPFVSLALLESQARGRLVWYDFQLFPANGKDAVCSSAAG